MLKYIGATIAVVGFFCLWATAGASDQNLLTFGEMVPQALLCLFIMAGGLLLARIAAQLERIKRQKGKRR